MPRNPQARRQRQQAIVDLIREKKTIGSQWELQELLAGKGILATQSSISRDLQDLGARRVKGSYVLRPWRAVGDWDFDSIIGLVEQITKAGPFLAVVQTNPNAAKLVARAIDEAGWEELAGTVAGEDTVFIATRTPEGQERLFQRFAKYLKA